MIRSPVPTLSWLVGFGAPLWGTLPAQAGSMCQTRHPDGSHASPQMQGSRAFQRLTSLSGLLSPTPSLHAAWPLCSCSQNHLVTWIACEVASLLVPLRYSLRHHSE